MRRELKHSATLTTCIVLETDEQPHSIAMITTAERSHTSLHFLLNTEQLY
jgi:hypothetical protein